MAKPLSLYRRVLGQEFDILPPALRNLHDLTQTFTFEGEAEIIAGSNIFSKAIALFTGLPTTSRHGQVKVRIEIDGDGEIWHRDFSGHQFHSRLCIRKNTLTERLGPHDIDFQLLTDATQLVMKPIRWKTCGIPLPRWLWPRITARENECDGRFQFEVSSSFPLIGQVIGYRGWLSPRKNPLPIGEQATH